MSKYDAVVIGAGVIGLSTAYHIKRKNPDLQILVVDKYNASGQGSTAKSMSAFRCLFSSKVNYMLSDSSVDFYAHVQNLLGVDLRLVFVGYLWLLSDGEYDELNPILRRLSISGLNYREYEAEELVKKLDLTVHFSGDEEAEIIGLKDIYKGIFIPKAGIIDADCIVKFYEEEFLKLGGEIRYGVKVEDLIVDPYKPLGVKGEPFFWQESRVSGIKTDSGIIEAKKTILAAGPWIPQFLDAIGVECFIKPKKRQVFAIKAEKSSLKRLLFTQGFNAVGCLPFTILPKPRVLVRPFPMESVFWLSYADDFLRAYKLEEDPQPEKNFYEYGIYQVLVKYFPQFKDCHPHSAFAGLYEINTLDGHPVVFEEKNLIVVGGASGSGIMKADALGRIAAALYDGEKYALLYGDKKFKVSDLSIRERHVEREKLQI